VEANSSFDEVYEVIFPLIYRFVSIRVPKPEVEDVAAEIIVKVWRGLPDIEILKPLPQEADQSETWATFLSVGEALAKLSTQQVNVIQLRLIEGFSAGEVAEILGTTQQAVDSLLYRAKKGFRKIYQGNPDKGGRG